MKWRNRGQMPQRAQNPWYVIERRQPVTWRRIIERYVTGALAEAIADGKNEYGEMQRAADAACRELVCGRMATNASALVHPDTSTSFKVEFEADVPPETV